MTKEVKETMQRMVIASIGFSVLAAVITLLVMKCYQGWELSHTKVLIGFAVGTGLACFMSVHMAYTLSMAVELGEDGAVKYNRKSYLIRTTVIAVVFVLAYFTGYVNILAMLGGLLCLKPAVFIQGFFIGGADTAVPTNIDEEEEL